ncbi:MAG: Holliday junction resolvase RuvX [Acaryochloridaceae cyanobacterium CSU_3_4]|nr:Holliday junction resolvase RuvX [Acaryochloridaceae cyanobacterium CSU_3_4]
MILGFDPGRDKCGVAVMGVDRRIHWHQVIRATEVINSVNVLCETYAISLLVIGNQTTSEEWVQRLLSAIPPNLRIIKIDERYSTLEARSRYWQIFPPQGLARFIPQELRSIRRPIDDIVAIVLIERYLDLPGVAVGSDERTHRINP